MVGKGTRLQRGSAAGSSVEPGVAGTPGKRTLTEDLAYAYESRTVGRTSHASAEQVEPPRSEPPRSEPPRSEPPRSEPPQSGLPRSGLPQSEPPRSGPPRSGLPYLDLTPRKASAGGVAPTAHAAPPRRVADAHAQEPNAIIKVVAYARGKLLGKPWGAKARWEGPLPQQYTGTRGPSGWAWDNPDAKTVRIGSDLQGRGGQTVEAWAGASADRIVVYATPLDAVTNDAEAEQDEHAPGHAIGKKDAGDSSSRSVKSADLRPGSDTAARDRKHGDGGTAGRTGDADGGTAGRTRDAGGADGAGEREQSSHGQDGDLTSLDAGDSSDTIGLSHSMGSSDADEELVDDFERELGLDLLDDDDDDDGAEQKSDPSGVTDRGTSSVRGRSGEDTRIGGTGPGGERARPDGDGQGSGDGGRGGSQEGSRDGAEGGAPDGMYGGEGKAGDGGVPSAVALFGGLISVPAALRGLVEVALIASSGNVTGAGAQLFKRELGKLASAALARTTIAQEARIVALWETKLALRRIATDKKTAQAWAKLTAAEKTQAARIIYWELQRNYFQGYLAAARRAKSEAEAALRKAPTSESAQQRLQQVELAEEAAAAPPVAGRLPQNHEFAGQQFPKERLPPAYRQQGLRFSEAGYPDFSPYAQTLPNGQKSVQIAYTGSRSGDFAAANTKVGYKKTPRGFRWHHHEDMKTMLLVPEDLHDVVKHTGGVATYKHTSGVASYGN